MYLTPAQIKGKIKSVAKQNKADPIALLRIYMMERFLERISHSKYRDCFIVKGGILVTSLIGVSIRSTMDIDTTIQNFDLNREKITEIIKEISDIKLDDHIEFQLNKVSDIMDDMEYPGIRIYMNAKLEKLEVPIKIDISTGDVITPKAVLYNYHLLLENRSISLWAYNVETILTEKMQTILYRNTLNTRMRDFYDVITLYSCYKSVIDYENLALAFDKTCIQRKTEFLLSDYNTILSDIATDAKTHQLWKNYCHKNEYAKHLELTTIIETLYTIFEKIQVIASSQINV